jgi:hypothetical protein
MNFNKLLLIFLILGLAVNSTAQEKTSENDNRLKGWLKKFPAADKDKDGILTMAEALDFKKSRQGRASNKKSATPQGRTVSGQSIPAGKEVKGYNGLFMGHSFFRPAAEHLLKVIPDTNVVNHTEYIVMSGGASGSPGMLWANKAKRDIGLKYLDTKKVEFFAMTYFSKENSSIEHYSKWFDYAISKNQNVSFMVALPWGTQLYKASKEELARAEGGYKRLYDDLIVPLRKKYPKNKIIYCPYGLGVYELISRLNKGSLPGIKHILSPSKAKNAKDQILKDSLGHGTELVTVLNSLIWMQTIYKYDISTIKKDYRVAGLPNINLNEIAAKVYKKIQPYNEIYK